LISMPAFANTLIMFRREKNICTGWWGTYAALTSLPATCCASTCSRSRPAGPATTATHLSSTSRRHASTLPKRSALRNTHWSYFPFLSLSVSSRLTCYSHRSTLHKLYTVIFLFSCQILIVTFQCRIVNVTYSVPNGPQRLVSCLPPAPAPDCFDTAQQLRER
jgi:hypothetical protein